jgi:hypothetical protein
MMSSRKFKSNKTSNIRKSSKRPIDSEFSTIKLEEEMRVEFIKGEGKKIGGFRESTINNMLRLIDESYQESVEKALVFIDTEKEVWESEESYEGESEKHLGLVVMKVAMPEGSPINASFHTHYVYDPYASFGDVFRVANISMEIIMQGNPESFTPEQLAMRSGIKYEIPRFFCIGTKNEESGSNEIWKYNLNWDDKAEQILEYLIYIFDEGKKLEKLFERVGRSSLLFQQNEQKLDDYVKEHLTDIFDIEIYIESEKKWISFNEYQEG